MAPAGFGRGTLHGARAPTWQFPLLSRSSSCAAFLPVGRASCQSLAQRAMVPSPMKRRLSPSDDLGSRFFKRCPSKAMRLAAPVPSPPRPVSQGTAIKATHRPTGANAAGEVGAPGQAGVHESAVPCSARAESAPAFEFLRLVSQSGCASGMWGEGEERHWHKVGRESGCASGMRGDGERDTGTRCGGNLHTHRRAVSVLNMTTNC